MRDLYGVTIWRQKENGRRVESVMVHADSTDDAIANVQHCRSGVDSIKAIRLGREFTDEFQSNHTKWLLASFEEYNKFECDGPIGRLL